MIKRTRNLEHTYKLHGPNKLADGVFFAKGKHIKHG